MPNGLCNNCNRDHFKVLFKENKTQTLQIVKCINCGLIYAYPQSVDKSTKFWEGSEKNNSIRYSKSFFSERMNYMIDQKEKLQVQDYRSSIEYIEKLLPNKGSVLEVGASRGYFIHELEKRNWIITGIEPSNLRRDAATRIFGYHFIPDMLEDTNLQANSFDVIFMFHVIEHVLDPSAFISLLYKFLKPGGILIMETPTYDTLTFKVLRHRERSVRCNGHFYFFTKKTLREVVCKSRFEIIRHDKVGRTLSVERLFWNIAVIIKKKWIEKILFKTSSVLKLNRIKIYLNMGDMQRIYCKKI